MARPSPPGNYCWSVCPNLGGSAGSTRIHWEKYETLSEARGVLVSKLGSVTHDSRSYDMRSQASGAHKYWTIKMYSVLEVSNSFNALPSLNPGNLL